MLPAALWRVDRGVMNVGNDPPAAGKSVQELLKLAPGIRVKGDQTSISSMGNSRVMINGKLLQPQAKI